MSGANVGPPLDPVSALSLLDGGDPDQPWPSAPFRNMVGYRRGASYP
jgi:hypothetical protein